MYAVPLSVHRHDGNMDLMAHRLQTLISEHELAGFVVDYSYEKSMTRSNGTTIQNFMNDLCKTGKLEDIIMYTYWKEDLIATKNMDFVVMHHVGFIL
ncbi:hypothetical protein LWI28_008178 [Acer negundo]|uniref:Uncharacterized protein n=1 Tax=Acer negundo TaxID=4023 RepID=A0AAD5J4K6_ACENE|nr:hypothetical protein LWI28_008178 [Acer negundo]